MISSLRRAFSDFHLSIDDLAVAGDTVWLRMTGSATNDGSFMGHAPTGRAMRVDVFDALRVEGDRIVEHWGSRAASAPSPSSASRTRPAAPAAA